MSHFDGMAALLARKEITMHLTSPPVQYLELEQAGIIAFFSSDDVLGGKTTFSNIFSSSKFRNANPRTFKAVLAAFTEAVELINKDRPRAAQIYLDVSADKEKHGRGNLKAARRPEHYIHDDAAECNEVRRLHVRHRAGQG
jgi:NitT/TauT family transport system substrate-binding protein